MHPRFVRWRRRSRKRNPVEQLDVGVGEMLSLIAEGVDWCQKPVKDQDDAVYAMDYIRRANKVLAKGRRLGLYRGHGHHLT